MPGGRSRYSTTFNFRAETDGLTRGFARARRETRQFTAQISGTFTELTNNARNFSLAIVAATAPLALLSSRGLQAANQIETLTRQTDLSARSAAGWVNAFRAFGAEASDVEDVLRTLTTRIIEFRRGEGTALEAFTALGASASDFTGDSSRNLQTFLTLLGAATPEARLFALDELVGDSAQFLSQMAESVDEVSRLRRAAERVHQPTERITTQWRAIRADIALAADTLGTSFIQGLVGTSDLSELTANLAENLPTIAESVERLGNAIRGFASFIGTIAPFLGIFGGALAGFRVVSRFAPQLANLRFLGLARRARTRRTNQLDALGTLETADPNEILRDLQLAEDQALRRAQTIATGVGAIAGAGAAGLISNQARNALRDAISVPVRDGVRQGLVEGIREPLDPIRQAAEDYSFALTEAVFDHRSINAELIESNRLWKDNLTLVQNIEQATISAFQNAPQAAIEFHRNLLQSTGEEIRRIYQGVRNILPESVANELDALLSTFRRYPETLIPLRESAADVTTSMSGLDDALAFTTDNLTVVGDSAAGVSDALLGLEDRLEGFITPRVLEPAERGRPRESFAGEVGFDRAAARLADATATYLQQRGGAFSPGFESLRASGAEGASLRALDILGGTQGVLDSIDQDEARELGASITERLTQSLQFGIRSSISGFFAGRDAGDLSALGENLLDAITGSIARNFADSITRSLFDPLIEGFVGSIFGSFNDGIANLGGQLANLIGAFFSDLFSGFSLGGFFSGIGSILGFQGGGRVPGPEGAPQLAIVHGGEVVLNRRQQAGLDSEGGGTNVTFNIQGDVTRQTRQEILSTIPDITDAVQRNIRRANYQLTGSYA